MAFWQLKNRASSTLVQIIHIADEDAYLATGGGAKFPTLPFFNVTICAVDPATKEESNVEICQCWYRSGDYLGLVRAQEGTSAVEHAAGEVVELRVTAGVLENIEDEILAIPAGPPGVSPAGTLILTAQAATPRTANGCGAAASSESSTNKINTWFLAFDKDSDEYSQWTNIFTPNDYDGLHFHARFVWHCAAGVGASGKTVCWSIKLGCWANDTAIDVALGTAVAVTDTWLHDAYFHLSDLTGPITPSNASANRHLVVEVMRDVSEDDLAGDALLDEVILTFTRA